MPHLFSNCAIDLLSIFEKILSFFQDVGAFDAYLFDHSSVKYDRKLDIYFGRFLSLLEEIKAISDRLKTTDHIKSLPNASDFADACVESIDVSTSYSKLPDAGSGDDLQDLLPVPAVQLASPAHPQLLTNHAQDSGTHAHEQNIITFEDALNETDHTSFVGSSINEKVSTANDDYIDSAVNLTSGDQLISSAIDGLVQDVSHHHDDNDEVVMMNNDELTFQHIQEEERDDSSLKTIESAVRNRWKSKNSSEELDNDENKIQSDDKGSFTCAHCGKVLSSRTSLLKHINIHSGIKPYCCEHCGKLFTTNTNLSAHLTRQHNLNTESAKSCSVCGKLFVRLSALKLHLAVHRGLKPFKCSVCDKSFAQKVTRDTHFLTHTRNYPFFCKLCPKRFPTKYKLSFHMKTHGKPQFSCSVCDKQFATKQYLKAHLESHNISQNEAAPCRLDTISNNSRPQVVEAPQIACAQCDLTFRSQRALTRHTRAKHDHLTQWFYCKVPDCPRPTKAFPTKYQLTKHNDRHHTEHRKKYVCKTCGKSFIEKNSLIRHQRQNHMVGLTLIELKPYPCQICSKRFFNKSKLTIHLSTHAESPQFRCELCSKAFYRKDSLKKHFKERHSPSATSSEPNKAVLSCPQCGKNFKSQSALVFHLQTHNGDFKYQCESCQKCFVRKCHYESHVRSHSESRPYKCATCGRAFKEKKHWKVHVRRVHTSPSATVELQQSMQSLLDSITNEAALCCGDDNNGNNNDQWVEGGGGGEGGVGGGNHHPQVGAALSSDVTAADCLGTAIAHINESYLLNAGMQQMHIA